MGIYIAIGLVLVLVLWLVAIYNGLVRLRNGFKNAFAQIDVQLKRRYELIPNLVETAKGAMAHERQTLEAVIQARNNAKEIESRVAQNPADAGAMRQLGRAESELSGSLGRFMALFEAYPDLKANQNMMQLSEELASTENRVAFARQAFNDAVMIYNNQREVFPNVFVANNFGFTEAQLLEVESAEERKAVKVSF
jgi:LemA protein